MNSSFPGQQRSSSTTSSTTTATSFNNYNFDFGIGSSRNNSSRPLKDQKNPSASATPMSTTASRPSYSPNPTSSSWAPNKPSWTHQPSPAATTAASAPRSGLSNPNSMVGDIFGKSWTSSAPSTATAAGIGLPKSDPTLFGDLLGSALGQGRSSSSNVPLKSAPPKNSFGMGNLSDSLPKTAPGNPVRQTSWGSSGKPGSYSTAENQTGSAKIGSPFSGGPSMKSAPASAPMMGGPSMKSSAAMGSAPMMGGPSMKSSAAMGSAQKKDPFGSLMDFSSKPSADPSPSLNSNPKGSSGSESGDYSFGAFQNSNPKGTGANDDYDFKVFQNSNPPKVESFGVPPPPDFSFQKPQASQPNVSVDPLDPLFTSSASSAPAAASNSQPFSEANDWDLGAEFGGNDGGGTTTELEGLPPPPAGVTASVAKSKGLDNYKQGQFADAIKWLSWAVVILEKSGEQSAMTEVLTCRASCYKEVGEYKKAVADCSKVLENESENISVLVQRALLYESTEKYKLGAEDLRAVLKIDPTNRVARTTIHRLNQLAG